MDHLAFADKFVTVCSSLCEMIQAVSSDPSILGSLSVDDYTLFASFAKEYAWIKGDA